jgi:hypothetical protein
LVQTGYSHLGREENQKDNSDAGFKYIDYSFAKFSASFPFLTLPHSTRRLSLHKTYAIGTIFGLPHFKL